MVSAYALLANRVLTRDSVWTADDVVCGHIRVCLVCRGIVVVCSSSFPALLLSYGSSHQTQGTRWFLIFAGALLGFSASLLWAAQGEIMMSYPLEKDKGALVPPSLPPHPNPPLR